MKMAPSMYVSQFLNRNSWNEISQIWPLFQVKEKEGSEAERSRDSGPKRWKYQQERQKEKKVIF